MSAANDIEAMEAALDADPYDWTLRGILADAYEDEMQMERASFLRLTQKHQKAPELITDKATRFVVGTWYWWTATPTPTPDGVRPRPNHLFAAIGEPGHRAWNVLGFRGYQTPGFTTRREAEEVLYREFLGGQWPTKTLRPDVPKSRTALCRYLKMHPQLVCVLHSNGRPWLGPLTVGKVKTNGLRFDRPGVPSENWVNWNQGCFNPEFSFDETGFDITFFEHHFAYYLYQGNLP